MLLRQVDVERQVAGGLDDLRQVLAADRADRVDRRAEPHAVGLGATRRHALGPGVDGAVAEPALAGVQLDVAAAVEAALEVARVEQGEPDAGLVGGLAHGEAHRVRVAVRVAARAVVDVVELPDDRDAGLHHLGEDGTREREVRVGVELLRGGIHLLAPAPEVAAAAVDAAAQRAVEGVAVRVGHAGQRHAGEADVAGLRVGVDEDLLEAGRPG